jgi:hypothetical protein
MIILLENTYLLDVKGIEKRLNHLWGRYQKILRKPNWRDLNEARAILYSVGQIYCETIAPEAIEKRLPLLAKPMTLMTFLSSVDAKAREAKELRKDPLFLKLEKFYGLVKKFKNRFNGGKYYLDEEKFIALYNKHNPDKELKIGYRGRHE